MKDKTTAGVLALFLGGFGGHKFYLGRTGAGLVYLIFCWTFIPAIVAFVDAIVLFTMSQGTFDLKYNAGLSFALPVAAPQNIVVNVANSANAGSSNDMVARLRDLQELKTAGVLSDSEFNEQKARVLATN